MIPHPSVIVYGTVCLDRFLLPGQADGNATELPGGEAFNTATALAGWGVAVTLTGTAIGDDAEGLRLRELLRRHPLARGIDISLVPLVSGAVTPVCTVQVDENGERYMSGRGFKEATAPALETILPRFGDRPLFAVDPNLGRAAVEATLAAAKAGCSVVSMDCANIPEILAVSEIAITSHEWVMRGWPETEVESMARTMVETGANTAIITQGKIGGMACTAHEHSGVSNTRPGNLFQSYSAAPLPQGCSVVDTTGAGDTFRAGICFGHATGGNLSNMLRIASASAALHCTAIGGGSRFAYESVHDLAKYVRVSTVPCN